MNLNKKVVCCMSEEFWTLFLVDDMYLMCQCPIFVLRPFEVPEGELGF